MIAVSHSPGRDLADGTWTPSVSKIGGSSGKPRDRIGGDKKRGEVVVRRQETSRRVWGLLYSIVGGLARDHKSIFGRQCGPRDRDFVWWAVVGLSDCCFVPRVLLLRRFANDDVLEEPAVRSTV